MSESYYILVADDNAINQRVIKGMLEHAGYRVDTVHNGEEAIEALEKACYDLVIMDCRMPVMDGLAATRIIRESSPSRFDPQIPILALTALVTSRDRENCLDAGMNDYISKPVVADSLYSMVSSFLGSSLKQGKSLPKPPASLIKSMSSLLVSDAITWAQELKSLGEAREFEEISRLAHKIRGAADVFDSRKLSSLAKAVENSGAEAEEEQALSLVAQLIQELRRQIRELQADK